MAVKNYKSKHCKCCATTFTSILIIQGCYCSNGCRKEASTQIKLYGREKEQTEIKGKPLKVIPKKFLLRGTIHNLQRYWG